MIAHVAAWCQPVVGSYAPTAQGWIQAGLSLLPGVRGGCGGFLGGGWRRFWAVPVCVHVGLGSAKKLCGSFLELCSSQPPREPGHSATPRACTRSLGGALVLEGGAGESPGPAGRGGSRRWCPYCKGRRTINSDRFKPRSQPSGQCSVVKNTTTLRLVSFSEGQMAHFWPLSQKFLQSDLAPEA